MGNSAVKQHYDTASKTGVFKLSQQKLEEFPQKLVTLNDVLRTIDLSENKISNIPPDIATFTLLKHLKLNKNKIAVIPDSISQLSKLESLSISDNLLKSIPLSLSKLTSLKQVNFSGNMITEFPLAFRGLRHLDVIDVSRNKITKIPDQIVDVHAVEIIVNQNQISSVSSNIASCPRLKTLRLEENCLQLESIPKELLKDSKISVLSLDGNLFEMKQLADVEGYEAYMERFTAVKKKMF